MKRLFSLMLILMVLIGLTSCAIPKSSGRLIRQAREEHGECTVVSITRADGGYTVVLHDVLQDFDYTVSSYKERFKTHKSDFVEYAGEKDTFVKCLVKKVVSEVSGELDMICKETGTRYLYDHKKSIYLLPVIFADDEEHGKKAAEAFAKVFMEHNLEGRMDNWAIVVYRDSDRNRAGKNGASYQKKFGAVRLPSMEYEKWNKDRY